MKADKGMTCGFEENIRRVLIDAEQREADACEEHSEGKIFEPL